MRAILALDDGTILKGNGYGKQGYVAGELVFNTAMTGYQEVLTDPSYLNQIVVFTYPHIGNTGINYHDSESKKIHCSGMIARNIEHEPSNWQSKCSLPDFLSENNSFGISGIDTRALTKRLRDEGSINACIMTGEIDESFAIKQAKSAKATLNKNLAKSVSTSKSYSYYIDGNPRVGKPLVVVDFGVKDSILRQLSTKLTVPIEVISWNSTFEEVQALDPCAVLLSNGPGDPQAVKEGIQLAKHLLKHSFPVLGICLGYQILGLALGASTTKMKFGHHGTNHPVQNIDTKRVYITSQNHNYAIDINTLPEEMIPTHVSLFDNTLQGFRLYKRHVFAYQGHPEAGPGPYDAHDFFVEFIEAVNDYISNTSPKELDKSIEAITIRS